MTEDDLLKRYRDFLKDSIRLSIDFSQTDQSRGIPPPPIEKPYAPDAKRIDLVRPDAWQEVGSVDVARAIGERQSHRRFRDEPLTLEEVAFLLWATQGVRQVVNPAVALRTVPSAGARHALETYLCVLNVAGLEAGIYRYLPLEHQLLLEFGESGLPEKIVAATLGQRFIARAPATFVWTAVPYRMEWRYGLAAHKVILLDAGHVCQNLYLACAAIGAGTCAVAAYHQERMDALVGVDGEEEFVIYLAPVGKV